MRVPLGMAATSHTKKSDTNPHESIIMNTKSLTHIGILVLLLILFQTGCQAYHILFTKSDVRLTNVQADNTGYALSFKATWPHAKLGTFYMWSEGATNYALQARPRPPESVSSVVFNIPFDIIAKAKSCDSLCECEKCPNEIRRFRSRLDYVYDGFITVFAGHRVWVFDADTNGLFKIVSNEFYSHPFDNLPGSEQAYSTSSCKCKDNAHETEKNHQRGIRVNPQDES